MKYQSFIFEAWMLINKVLRFIGSIIGVVIGVVIGPVIFAVKDWAVRKGFLIIDYDDEAENE